MPIGKEEWNSGSKSDTFEKQILSFLRKNQDTTYTLPEIVTAMGYKIDTHVGSHGIRRKEKYVAITAGAENHRVSNVALDIACDQVAHHNPSRLTVHYDQIQHFTAGEKLYFAGCGLAG